MKIKQLVLAYFPKYHLIAIFCGLFLKFHFGYDILSNIILNLIIALFFIKIAIIIHESGHLIWSKIIGGKPRVMILGSGHEIIRFKLFDIRVIINSLMKSGFAISDINSLRFLRIKYLFRACGGILANLSCALLVYQLYGFNFESFSGASGIDLSTSFIISNGLLAVLNLIPYKVCYQGVKIPNDGLAILKILFGKIDRLERMIQSYNLFDAFEYYEDKQYDKAIKIYEDYLMYNDKQLAVIMNLSIMHVKKGKFDMGLSLLKDNEELLAGKKNNFYKALYNNNLAWIYLIKKEYEKADKHSKKATSLNDKEKNFIGTRGSVLIEKGEVSHGIKMLKKLVDFEFPNSQTISAAMYLCYAFHLKDDLVNKQRMIDFISSNMNKLDFDEIKIWRNIKERML